MVFAPFLHCFKRIVDEINGRYLYVYSIIILTYLSIASTLATSWNIYVVRNDNKNKFLSLFQGDGHLIYLYLSCSPLPDLDKRLEILLCDNVKEKPAIKKYSSSLICNRIGTWRGITNQRNSNSRKKIFNYFWVTTNASENQRLDMKFSWNDFGCSKFKFPKMLMIVINLAKIKQFFTLRWRGK
jgi:hypothetical protein